jgi:hypothetical protein
LCSFCACTESFWEVGFKGDVLINLEENISDFIVLKMWYGYFQLLSDKFTVRIRGKRVEKNYVWPEKISKEVLGVQGLCGRAGVLKGQCMKLCE